MFYEDIDIGNNQAITFADIHKHYNIKGAAYGETNNIVATKSTIAVPENFLLAITMLFRMGLTINLDTSWGNFSRITIWVLALSAGKEDCNTARDWRFTR